MRILIYPATAAAMLATVFLILPAQAAHYRPHYRYYAHPYWRGEPTDYRPIWRYGYYQGNDPDQFIRGQIMRDPTNGLIGRR
jgi:hypothetical protein